MSTAHEHDEPTVAGRAGAGRRGQQRGLRRAARSRAAVMGAAMLLVPTLAACSADGDSTTAASIVSAERGRGPDRAGSAAAGDDATDADAVEVLARTASQLITSGRLEVTMGDHRFDAAFDGDDLRASIGGSGTGDVPGVDGEVVLVDGSAYLRLGERWVRIPGLEHLPLGGDALIDVSGVLDRVRGALEDSKVTEPGEPTTLDGVAVTRYRSTLTGEEALGVLGGDDTAAAVGDAGGRARRIADYALEHTSVTLVGDVAADGTLRRLEVTSSADTSAYPSCVPLSAVGTSLHVVLDDIGGPQEIAAPPAEAVDDLTDLHPADMLDGLAGGLGDIADRFVDGLGERGPGGDRAPTSDLFAGCPE